MMVLFFHYLWQHIYIAWMLASWLPSLPVCQFASWFAIIIELFKYVPKFIQIDIKDTVFYTVYYIYEIIRKEKFCSACSAFLHNFMGWSTTSISSTYQQGYKAISILIDSGASDSVAPPGLFYKINVLETDASRAGLEYTAAGGHKIPNLGMCRPIVYRTDGSGMTMAFQVAGVSKALCAVSRIVGNGNRVIFDHPNEGGSYIENKTNSAGTS